MEKETNQKRNSDDIFQRMRSHIQKAFLERWPSMDSQKAVAAAETAAGAVVGDSGLGIRMRKQKH